MPFHVIEERLPESYFGYAIKPYIPAKKYLIGKNILEISNFISKNE